MLIQQNEGQKGETLTNQVIPNLTYRSQIVKKRPTQLQPQTSTTSSQTTLLNSNNQTKMTMTNTTPKLSCLH